MQTKFWAIEPGYFDRAKAIVLQRISQEKTFLPGLIPGSQRNEDTISKRADLITFETGRDEESGHRFFKVNGKRIGYVPIQGSLTKMGDLCAYGMYHYGQWIARMEKSGNIDAIVLDVDSPGGTVDGTIELADIISQVSKPVITYTDGMLASAAYWLASQTDHIMANKLNYNDIGSIGTLMVYINQSKFIEDKIGSVEIIRAPQSQDKARLNSLEPIPKDARKKLMGELEEITDTFISAVKAGRSGKLANMKENIFTGKTYNNEEAADLGLIDSLGTFADALQLAADMASQRREEESGENDTSTAPEKAISNTNHNHSMKFKSTWSAILAFFGLPAADAEKEQLTEERVTQLNDQLDTLQQDNKALREENNQLQTENDQLSDQLEAAKADHAASLKKIEELEAKLEKAPAGHATSVVADSDKGPEYENKNEYETSADREAAELRKAVNVQQEN